MDCLNMAYTPYSDIYSFVAKVLNHYVALDTINELFQDRPQLSHSA